MLTYLKFIHTQKKKKGKSLCTEIAAYGDGER